MLGVKLEVVKGDTLKQKLDHIFTADGSTTFVMQANSGDGFWCVHDEPNAMMTVPAGYITATLGKYSSDKDANGCHGLRWCVMDFTNKATVTSTISHVKEILQTYPGLKDSEYSKWLECLEKYLLPQASG